MLQIGQPAPAFSLPDASMEMMSLSSYRGKKNVVLYFYPKDGTPGCTIQAIDFSDREKEFQRLDTVIFGVSRDDVLSHAAFRDEHGLTVQLLADTEEEVCKMYDVLAEKSYEGRNKTMLRVLYVAGATCMHATTVASCTRRALNASCSLRPSVPASKAR